MESAYRERPAFVGLKARLLATCSVLMLVLLPLNSLRLLWTQPPMVDYRFACGVCMVAAALLALRWIKRGHVTLAGNGLVLVTIVSVHVILLLAPTYPHPLSAAILIFVFDLVFLLLALVFASGWVAAGVLALVVASHWTFHFNHLQGEHIPGSLEAAANTLLREGLVVIALMFCLGMALVRMIAEAHRRSEEALEETRKMNMNLNRLVTERTHDLEVAIAQANDASRAKGDFLANMSHEIRTPLNGIIASADLLWRRPDLTPAAAEHVRLIADSGELLLKQLSDVLDFSKIEAGQLDLEAHCFDLVPLVADCVALMKTRAEEVGVELDYHVDPNLCRPVTGDSFRLRQVLLNLTSNAIKFTPAGGRVQLAVTCSDPLADALRVCFEVRDSGIGMDAATKRRVFERFTQADSSTTRRYGGTGLGLAISARLVRMMGGVLEAESVPDEGSTFHFTLPLQVSETAPVLSVPVARQKPPQLGLRVLVAEDNAVNRKILASQLEALGCQCRIVTDGEEVLVALRQDALPDVVLMDCHMPNLDGWEATRRLRSWADDGTAAGSQQAAGRIPVIALTAAALPEERERCWASGMDHFLSKPVKLTDLQAALQPFMRTEPGGN